MKEGSNIPIRNIYYMLAYAFNALQQDEYRNLAAEQFEHAHNLFAAILSLGVGKQLKQGLYREYKRLDEELPTLRGKVDIEGTVSARLARRRTIVCEYDELSEDNELNRAIKATCMLLMRHGEVSDIHKAQLRREMLFFSNVADQEPSTIRWDALRPPRLDRNCKMLISICQMVIEGMLITTTSGVHRLAQFIDDQRLHRLFEKFVLNYYLREHPYLGAKASHIPWVLDAGTETLLPTMQSDITLRQGNNLLIIDTKFYNRTLQSHYNARTIRSNNLYQIFTYVKNREASFGEVPHKVSGMLLYARTKESVQPDESYVMSGNSIEVRTLDLGGEFDMVTSCLDEIAHRYFQC